MNWRHRFEAAFAFEVQASLSRASSGMVGSSVRVVVSDRWSGEVTKSIQRW